MRVFAFGMLAAIVLAIGAGFALNAFQKTSADAYKSSEARLNQEESVNNLGRQASS